MTSRRRLGTARPDAWAPRHPVPWTDTGDLRLDLLRAAVEARLYPYGDLVSSPGRSVAAWQLSLLERGHEQGMDDQEVGAFLSANLACGLTTVYRRDGSRLAPAGCVLFSGRYTPPDFMGRCEFFWSLEVRPGAGGTEEPRARWEAGELCDAFRRAFGVAFKALPACAPAGRWEDDQALLF
jgi:hypothetical protein